MRVRETPLMEKVLPQKFNVGTMAARMRIEHVELLIWKNVCSWGSDL